MYPLAHDKLGNAVDIPEKAACWRVRRITGRQGRPGFVYGQDGAPLKVPLDATAEDLQAAGCGPGTYKLDALDEEGRPAGVSAFTEITTGDDDEESSRRPANAGADALQVAVESLARTVEAMQRSEGPVRVMEAMQRVQAEREKVTGQVLIALIDKLGGRGSPTPPQDLRTAIKQALAVQEAMDEASERRGQKLQSAAPAPTDDDDGIEEPKPTADRLMNVVGSAVEGLVPLVAPALQAWIFKKIGITGQQVASAADASTAANRAAGDVRQAAGATAKATGTVEQEPQTGESGTDATPENAGGDAAQQPQGAVEEPLDAQQQAAAQARFEEIWAKLAPEEQVQAADVLRRLKPATVNKLIGLVMQLGVDEAVDFLRGELRRLAARKAKKACASAEVVQPGAAGDDKGQTSSDGGGLASPAGDEKGQVNS